MILSRDGARDRFDAMTTFGRPLRVPCDRRPKRCALHERYAVIDVETTGIDPRVDRVVEVACVVVDGARVVSAWSSLVNPERDIPKRVTRIHGIHETHVARAPVFADIEAEFLATCASARPVAHNARFDRGFLSPLHDRSWLCTRAFARRVFPEAPAFGNQRLREFLQIDDDLPARPIAAHRALDDALVTAHILIKCLWREAEHHATRKRSHSQLAFEWS